MATDNNIRNFTAADIEKYHKGQLSPKEMHDLEKAAMDDPFLADALEGYAVAGVDVENDIAELKNRLAGKMKGAKVIPLPVATSARRKNNFRILKVAAMLIMIAGAAFLVYQLGLTNKQEAIAKNEPVQNKITDPTAPASTPSEIPVITGSDTKADELEKNDPVTDKTILSPGTADGGLVKQDKVNASGKEKDLTTGNPTVVSTPVTSSVAISEEKRLPAKEDINNKPGIASNKDAELAIIEPAAKKNMDDSKNRAVVQGKKNENQGYNFQNAKIFRGRVTDENNVGVPFANVTNLEENTGTYTDARGYFNLTYPDTVLNVQVRSIGFENTNVQLRNTSPTNQVILQDDKSLSEVVISNQKPNLLARSNNNTMQLEEPEPADGWSYYDNYLLNNLQLPEEYKSKPVATGEVLVSFEVNGNGEPINFKIEISLCSKCDQEAIRLIKEGPKWRRKAKNGRTTVTIPF